MSNELHSLLGDGAPTRESVKRAVRAVVAQAQRSRLPPPRIEIAPVTAPLEFTATSAFEVEDPNDIEEVLGIAVAEIAGRPTAFKPETSRDLPLLQRLYRRFRAALPGPRLVRVLGEADHATFLGKRREPYLAALADRVLRLEQLLASHVADHGDGHLARVEAALRAHETDAHAHDRHEQEVLGARVEVDRATASARHGGMRVPLSLEPGDDDKFDCWQDGEELLCSVRLLAPDGKIRIATTGSGIARPIDDVISYAADAGVDPVEIVGVLPALAQVLGGSSLGLQLCSAARGLLARPEVVRGEIFVGRMVPKSDPGLAAAAELLQRSQRGDAAASAEVARMRRGRGAALLSEAEARIAGAQAAKAKFGRVI